MCGIVGALFRDSDQAVHLESALELLHHRGPDDRGFWHNRILYLGHTRLSILDLSPLGHQPMSYLNQRFWITFNGEIYNFLELRRDLVGLGHQFRGNSDTEVLLAAYAQWGETCLSRLQGMFAFAIWDQHQEKLFLARDRCGEKPLYYWRTERAFYFASELKAILSILPEVPALDPVAIDLYLHYQYVPEPLTPLVNLVKLPAAHSLSIQLPNWEFGLKRYWSFGDLPAIEGDPATLIRQELENSVALTLRSDVPVGIALSGGLDSSAIAAIAAQHTQKPLQAFSIGYPGRPDAYDERDQAASLAKHLGFSFHDLELTTTDLVNFFPQLVSACDEPIADIAAYGHYAVMQLAAEHGIKVMLSGLGGDELFGGYEWVTQATRLTERKKAYLNSPLYFPLFNNLIGDGLEFLTDRTCYYKLCESTNVPYKIKSLFNRVREGGLIYSRYTEEVVYQNVMINFAQSKNNIRAAYNQSFQQIIPNRNANSAFRILPEDNQDTQVQICQLLFQTWLVSNCLSLGDRVSMSSGVEMRLPLLSNNLVGLVIGLRKRLGNQWIEQKYWLKRALEDILPTSLLRRPKKGFQPPTQEWILAIIHKYQDFLKNGYLIELGIFDYKGIDRLISIYQKDTNQCILLYKILLLEIWYRQLVAQE